MTLGQLDRVAVVASSVTELRPAWTTLQHVDLISRVVSRTLAGSGLRIDDVDFVINSGSDVLDGRSISNCGFLGAMGAHHKEESRVEEDGLWSLTYAVDKIASGSARVGLVVAYAKPSESDLSAYYATIAEPFYQRPVGLDHGVAHGLLADQYLTVTGADPTDFDTVAAHDWAAAAGNRALGLRDAPDAAKIAASPALATPLRELHMSRPVDGAVAVLVTTEEIAHRISPRPVWISGYGSSMDSQMLSRRVPGRLPAVEVAASTALRRAGLSGAADVDVVELAAGSAVGELLVLEALGLAAPGSGVSALAGGSGPAVNPSGGSLPADPILASGLVRIAEASAQLAGRAGPGRPRADRALVYATNGIGMQNHCVVTLEV